MKIVFNTYTTKKGDPEDGYWEILQYLEGLKEKDLLVRVDIGKKTEYSLEEEDFFFPSLKISHLKLNKLDGNKFEAEFDTKYLRCIFVFLLTLGKHGNGGHSYEVLIGKKSFYIDGDGADHLVSINGVSVNKIKEHDIYHWAEIYNKDVEKDNNMKYTMNEQQIRSLISNTVKKVLKESGDEWDYSALENISQGDVMNFIFYCFGFDPDEVSIKSFNMSKPSVHENEEGAVVALVKFKGVGGPFETREVPYGESYISDDGNGNFHGEVEIDSYNLQNIRKQADAQAQAEWDEDDRIYGHDDETSYISEAVSRVMKQMLKEYNHHLK
jgi:hypothetical protein